MDLSHDELAGVVDLFGALTPAELTRAIDELAYRRGDDVDPDAVGEAIDDAIGEYALVEIDGEGTARLVAGPAAFPELPAEATDLPHIMDVERRTIDRAEAARTALNRLEAEVATVVDAGDEDRAAQLREVTYDLEAWGPVTAAELRDRLETA